MNASQLSQLIEKIVEKELSKRLPSLVESVLTKRYLKDLVSEHVQKVPVKTSRLAEVMSEDDEEVPGPMPNTDAGIYQKDPLVKEQRKVSTKAAIAKLTKGDSQFAAFFEGTQPVGAPDAPVTPAAQELVSESTLNKMFDMSHMQRLAKAVVPKSKKPQAPDPETILQERRKMLDERIVGNRPPAPAPTPTPRPRVVDDYEDPFEAKMRAIEERRSRLGV